MSSDAYQKGSLIALQPDDPDEKRVVAHRFVDGVSGEIKVLSRHAPLQEGETYVLATGERDIRIEILARRYESDDAPWSEYLFRVV